MFEEGIAVTTYASLRGAWGSLPAEVLAKRDCVTLTVPATAWLWNRARYSLRIVSDPGGWRSRTFRTTARRAHFAVHTLYERIAAGTLGGGGLDADGIVSIEEERALMGHALQNPELDAPEGCGYVLT